MEPFENDKMCIYLLHKQHLLPGSMSESILQVAEALCGLHATCPSTPYLSLFARMIDFSKDDLKLEVEVKKSLIRTRSVRNTLHLMPVTNSSMIFAALKFQQNKRSEKYLRHLGITLETFNKLADKILLIIAGNGLTANEIKKATGNSPLTSHVINILCDEGILVRGKINGGWKSNNHRYYLFGDFFCSETKTNIIERDAIISLISEYLKTYGPVTAEDISWWSGICKSAAKEVLALIGKQVKEIRLSGEQIDFFMLEKDYSQYSVFQSEHIKTVNFLPALDPFIMGYRLRSRFLNIVHNDYVFDRYGNASPTIILDGKVIGIWDADEKERLIKFYLFYDTEDHVYENIVETGIKTAGFYFDGEADVLQIREAIPVKQLTVGSFMSPLKNA
ncbi:MAG: AlkZ family DNA glycosylase [Bacteroidales bacterium]|nr:AlkZ family DNA glycosylase [Bacteroidales bacterium]